jgi:hypothetical protein
MSNNYVFFVPSSRMNHGHKRSILFSENTYIKIHYAVSRNVAGSSPDEVDFLNWPNPSGRTMALGSTQPLTEMSTRNP